MVARALGLIGWIYFLLPWRIAHGFAVIVGNLLKWTGLRSKVVRSNLKICFPGDDLESFRMREELFRKSYVHLGHLFFEVVMLFGPMKYFIQKRSRPRGVENWKQAQSKGRGVIFLSSHVGNWEIMAAQGGMLGMELMIVTKKLKPDWFHRAIECGRSRVGVTGTYEPRTFRDIMKHLKAGKTVGFVLDQYAGPPIGVRVPFFGHPVGTASVVAAVAKRTGAIVLPVINHRLSDGTWEVQIQSPIEWKEFDNTQRALAENTARYVSILEQHVRRHPDQWLWIHRRFKGDLSPLREDEWSEARTR